MKVHEANVESKCKYDEIEEDYEALEKIHRHLGDQVETFSSYQPHVGSPPSYQPYMMHSKLPPIYAVRTQNNEKLMKSCNKLKERQPDIRKGWAKRLKMN